MRWAGEAAVWERVFRKGKLERIFKPGRRQALWSECQSRADGAVACLVCSSSVLSTTTLCSSQPLRREVDSLLPVLEALGKVILGVVATSMSLS